MQKEDLRADSKAQICRMEHLEQQIQYMKVQHDEEVEEFQSQLEELESTHRKEVQDLHAKLKESSSLSG